jgi:hypothetical protein
MQTIHQSALEMMISGVQINVNAPYEGAGSSNHALSLHLKIQSASASTSRVGTFQRFCEEYTT